MNSQNNKILIFVKISLNNLYFRDIYTLSMGINNKDKLWKIKEHHKVEKRGNDPCYVNHFFTIMK